MNRNRLRLGVYALSRLRRLSGRAAGREGLLIEPRWSADIVIRGDRPVCAERARDWPSVEGSVSTPGTSDA